MTRAHRVSAERHGHRSEAIAAWWLRLKLYRIVARRYRTAAGEIDLIVRRGRTLVFVEVKARADFRVAAEAVSPRQQHRIARAASQFLAARPDLAAAYSGCLAHRALIGCPVVATIQPFYSVKKRIQPEALTP